MIGFLLTGHGEFAPGLASALELVAGKQEAFKVVPFDVEKAAEYPELLHTEIEQLREETDAVLVFVDLLGGTPFNQAMMIANDIENVEVVTGTNLPMLIELLLTRSGAASLEDLAAQAVAVGQTGIVHKSIASIGVAQAADDDEDGI